MQDVNSSPLVLITVLTLTAVYLVVAALGRRWDLMDLRRISFVPLCGKDGPYKYEVLLVTGSRKGAGQYCILPRMCPFCPLFICG